MPATNLPSNRSAEAHGADVEQLANEESMGAQPKTRLTLIQAQQRFIDRVNSAHPGHRNRVRRSAWKQLRKAVERMGNTDPEAIRQIVKDANDMAELERNAED